MPTMSRGVALISSAANVVIMGKGKDLNHDTDGMYRHPVASQST